MLEPEQREWIAVEHPRGIYLPEPDLWLDPPFGVKRAFVSHAHADHVARHDLTFCSELTARLMGTRFGMKEEARFRGMPWREAVEWEGWVMRLLPAGHIVGSAMLHLTRMEDGATLLYTGDYKLRQGLSAEKAELMVADTLIMETTFGLPQYVFPPVTEVVGRVLKWVVETLDDGGIPVLLGYSLGKAQEILCALKPLGVPVMLHPAVWKVTASLQTVLGDQLPEMRPFDEAEAAGHVLVFPPNAARAQGLKKLKGCRRAMLSGWAMQSGARFRYQVDEVFPLSDHADYPELLQTVAEVRPRRVWLVHGSVREFAADLRRRGFDARALGLADQLELELTGSGPEREDGPQVEEVSVSEGDRAGIAAASFSGWVETCVRAAGEAARGKKLALLAGWFRVLEHARDLELGVRYAAGMVFEPGDMGGPLQAGWALLRRVLIDLAGCSEAEYRVLSKSQNDAGRTAHLMLLKRPAGVPFQEVMLAEVAAFFEALRAVSGAMAKAEILKKQLARMPAREGSWLVRLMTGDLRMGSKEGLVEEAVALAFDRTVEAVREAVMLGGDPGRAAVLAREDRLAEAKPQLFVPLKVMLASPEESAEAIWQRMTDGDEGSAAVAGLWMEDKYDGIRAQVHRSAGRVEIYTRDLKRVTEQFPEVTAAMRDLDDEVILDGELIAHAEGKKLSFSDLQKRLGRRDQADLFLPSAISVRYVVFDLLWQDGESLLRRGLEERRGRLEALRLPGGDAIRRIEVLRAVSAEEVEAGFWAARRRGNEGLILKEAFSAYWPGRRGKAWLKLKKAFATLDVVVVKVELGHGKRSQVLSDYTFAVREEETGLLRVIGKAYSGLTDLEIEELTEHFLEHTVEEKGRVRVVVPEVVLEVAFDAVQVSARHDSGLALRFPRIKAIRRDKTAAEIDTLAYARRLAGVPA
jgi:DNA ligase-1